MKIFIDSANLEDIEVALRCGILRRTRAFCY